MTTTIGASADPTPVSDPAPAPDHPTSRSPATTGPARPRRTSGLFAPFWRWHFYASFLVVPILAVLAVTGLIYLFRFQLEPALHPDLMRVAVPADPFLMPYQLQQQRVEEALAASGTPDAAIVSMTEPATPDAPTRFSVALSDDASRDYFVNPYDATVLGSLDPDTTLSGTAVRLHADLMVGLLGDRVIEIATCWAIVMALTGYYLFVRGRAARRRVLVHARKAAAGAPGSGRLLRDGRLRQRHAVGGAVVGVALLGMLVTGLPWTGVWGEQAQRLASSQGTSFWSDDPGAVSDPTSTLDESLPHSHTQDVPWALGKDERPTSSDDGTRSVANLDTAVLVAAGAGLARPLTVVLPETDDGVFSSIGYAFEDPAAERTVHVSRFGGDVVSTYGYADYPALAKVVSHGIALHEGRHFGVVNMIGSAAVCVLVLVMCVTGPLMWWRRRPRGQAVLGAPRARMPLRATPVLVVAVVALGIFLPLFGITLVAVLLLDQLVLRRVPVLARWFGVKP